MDVCPDCYRVGIRDGVGFMKSRKVSFTDDMVLLAERRPGQDRGRAAKD